MSEIVIAPVIKDERYEAFKDEVESTVAAYIHLDNENRKRFYWTLGDTIVTFVKENDVKSVTNLVNYQRTVPLGNAPSFGRRKSGKPTPHTRI
jgi:hypothetical protein